MAKPVAKKKYYEEVLDNELEQVKEPVVETEPVEAEPEPEEKPCCGKCKDMRGVLDMDKALEIIARHMAGYEIFLACMQDAVVYRRKVQEFAKQAILEINERYKETITLTGENN